MPQEQTPTQKPLFSQAPADVESLDRFHALHRGGGLYRELWAQAVGAEYPAEVEPSSSCTWSVLGAMVAGLRLPPDGLLVDLGCGRGGTGLWLARAFSARLIGIDASPEAVRAAAARAADFLPAGRARFELGVFENTGLPDTCADGAVSMDALPFAEDRDAALRELKRVLRPGARALFTGMHRLPGHSRHDPTKPSWPELIERAGLILESAVRRPEEPELWRNVYKLWIAHETELRAELGDERAGILMDEARRVGPNLEYREPYLFTVRAPE